MFPHGRLQRRIGEDVAVVDKKRSVQKKVRHIRQAAAGFQQHRFMTENDRATIPVSVRKRRGVGLRQMVGVHHKFPRARRPEMREGMRQQRPVMHGDQRFRQLIRQRFQASAQSRA